MKKLGLSILSLGSLIFLSSFVPGINLPSTTRLDSSEEQKVESTNTPYKFSFSSENESISIEFPYGPQTETYKYFFDEDEFNFVTSSYREETVYILSIEKKSEDWDEAVEYDWDDEEEDEEALEEISAQSIVLSGFPAEHIKAKMSGNDRREFLSCYVDEKFADHMIQKYSSLQLHGFLLDTLDHEVQMIVCGPPDQQSLEEAALKYAHSLQVTPH